MQVVGAQYPALAPIVLGNNAQVRDQYAVMSYLADI